MSATPSNTLLPPFDDIGFAWYATTSGIAVEYTGNASRLLECGAIEPHMAEKAKAKSKPRLDSAGHYFHRSLRIVRRPLREDLVVTRLIMDQQFAETLPGVPRGLRFKLFDWLDAHPHRVHVVTEKEDGETGTITTGSINNLVAVGFHDSLFEQRFTLFGRDLWRFFVGGVREHHVDRALHGFSWGRIKPLMRGYFEITLCSKTETAPAVLADQSNPKPERAKRRVGSALRLVIDNTKEASHE